MMTHIRSIKKVNPKSWNGKTILYMHGYGGFTWEASRHLKVLSSKGYSILALDFTDILESHNPDDLISLMDQVDAKVEEEGLLSGNTIIVGLSLGGLVGFNLIKRHKELTKLFIITGGDMTHIPSKRSLKMNWGLTRAELAEKWKDVNIYTDANALSGKHIVMLLPRRDKVIDPDEVIREINRHSKLNDVQLIRTPGGHFRTIITETILFPKKSLDIIDKLADL